MKRITVAVVGNPNVGKTTLLNAIAGTSLKVGNWPGVTVEKKEAFVKFGNYEIHFVDLPGIYTLEPISEDERIAINFLKKGKVDVILNILDSTNLERSLLLTAELLPFKKPTVLILNLVDEAEKLGIEIDKNKLSELLGVKVIKTVASKGKGVEEILPAIIEAYEKRLVPSLGEEIPEKLSEDEKFAIAHGIYEEVVKKKKFIERDLTDLIDNFALHPILGIFIFVAVIFLLFKIAFDFSSPFVDWIDGFFNEFLIPAVASVLNSLHAPEIFSRFFAEAVVGGVGFVLTFVPLIFVLYLLITFLEMSGYIPRVAFLFDKYLHKLGLHGKSVIPLILALGCNVPAIVATRTLESWREKLLVIAMIPFISCPARLVVFSFFALVFFPEYPALVITVLYLLGVVVAFFTAILLKKTALRGGISHFVIELPPYRFPSLKTVLNISWIHVKDFLYRAGTLIFAASILIWVLLNLPPGVSSPKDSFAGKIGQTLIPVFKPMGIDDWQATTSLIPAFLAREIVLSSMGVIYSAEEHLQEKEEKTFSFSEALKEQVESLITAVKDAFTSLFSLRLQTFEVEEEEGSLRHLIKQSFDKASALAFMIFILIYTSCLGTYATMGKELGYKLATLFLAYSFLLAWLLGTITYNLFR